MFFQNQPKHSINQTIIQLVIPMSTFQHGSATIFCLVIMLFNINTNYLLFQSFSEPYWLNNNRVRKFINLMFFASTLAHLTVEISSYIILFCYISQHDNKIAKNVLKPSVIKSRNRANAVNLTGLVLGWLMEVWYIFLVGVLSFILDQNAFWEVSALLKYYEFYLIPLVQVHTSPALKKFRINSENFWIISNELWQLV